MQSPPECLRAPTAIPVFRINGVSGLGLQVRVRAKRRTGDFCVIVSVLLGTECGAWSRGAQRGVKTAESLRRLPPTTLLPSRLSSMIWVLPVGKLPGAPVRWLPIGI